MYKYGFVYIWYDSALSKKHQDEKIKRYYIGAHWGPLNDGYTGSSNWLKNSLRKRPNDFKRRILSIHYSKEEMFNEEYRVLQMIRLEELGEKYYNNVIFHYMLNGERIVSEKTKRKMSASAKGRVVSEEQRIHQSNIMKEKYLLNKITPWNKGKKNCYSEKHLQNMRGGAKNRPPQSEHTKRKRSESMKGKIVTKETREKIGKANSISLLGKKQSAELIEKRINPLRGQKRSKEFCKHLSELNKGKSPSNKGKPMSEEQKQKLRETWVKKKISV